MTHKGGKIYGIGAKGVVIDVPYIETDTNTLSYLLSRGYIRKLILIGVDSNLTLTSDHLIEKLRQYLSIQTSIVCKIFKNQLLPGTTKKYMKNEVFGMDRIAKIFGPLVESYTTIQFLKFQNFPFLGMIVKSKRRSTYITFNSGCSNHIGAISMNIDAIHTMIQDVLESLVLIQEHGINHTDIKPDNIVYCGKTDNKKEYRLIDWELSQVAKFENRVHGSLFLSSPISMYIDGFPKTGLSKIVQLGTGFRQKKYRKSKLFKYLHKKTLSEFKYLLSTDPTHKFLFNTYKNTFDLYGLGGTVAILCVTNNIDPEPFLPFIEKCMSQLDPYKNAKEALEAYNEMFD